MSSITCIAPWLGSKRTLAEKIIQQLGPHSIYVEPFCGSCAVLFRKNPSPVEIVNDLHTDLINLCRVLASKRWRELYRRLARTLYCEGWQRTMRDRIGEPFDMDADGDVTDECVDRAYAYFVTSWQGRNGMSGTSPTNLQMSVRWTDKGGNGPTRYRSAVASVRAMHERLKSVSILNRDAFDVLESTYDGHTAIYVDPPYLASTRSSGTYIHDFSPSDHERLAALLRGFRRARVVVSYYRSPLLRTLYPGWEEIACDRIKHLSAQGKRGPVNTTSIAEEVLLVNGDVYGDEAGSLFRNNWFERDNLDA
jgi:DNA adenine methylase